MPTTSTERRKSPLDTVTMAMVRLLGRGSRKHPLRRPKAGTPRMLSFSRHHLGYGLDPARIFSANPILS
jgi:hypothetical protein